MSVTFRDGPAAGASLDLRRAPVMLRVVVGPRGKVDALDQLDDVAEPNERIFVYRLDGGVQHFHIKSSRRGESGWRVSAHYRQHLFHPPPPPDEVLRDNRRWVAWCLEHRDRLDPSRV